MWGLPDRLSSSLWVPYQDPIGWWRLGTILVGASASLVATHQPLSVLLEPTPQGERLALQDPLSKVIPRPNEPVFPLVLKQIPKIAQVSLSELRVLAKG